MFKKLIALVIVVGLIFPTTAARADGPIVLGLGRLTSIALSPDGSTLAAGTAIGVYFYDALTFAPQRFWDTGYSVNFLRWSPRGDVLAVIHDGTKVDFRSTADGRVLWSTTVPWRRAVEFSADGSQVIVSTRNRNANVFDALTGSTLGAVVDELGSMPDWYVSISPNRKWQAYSFWWNEGEISLQELGGTQSRKYSLRDNQEGQEWHSHIFAWSPDSLQLYSVGSSSVYVWDVNTGRELRRLSGFSGSVKDITWSADGRYIVSTEGNNLVVSDVASRQPVRVIQLKKDSRELLLNPLNELMVLDGRYGDVTFYGIDTLSETRHYATGRDPWRGVFAFGPDGHYLAVGGRSAFVNIRDALTGQAQFDLPGAGSILALAFSSDSQTLYTIESINQIRQWDLATRTSQDTLLTTACANGSRIFGAAIHVASRRVVVECERDIVVCDLATGDLLYPLTGHSAEGFWVNVLSITINPQGTRVAAIVGKQRAIKIWNLETGALLAEYTGHTDWVSDIVFSPNQDLLASGGDDGTIRIWPVP